MAPEQASAVTARAVCENSFDRRWHDLLKIAHAGTVHLLTCQAHSKHLQGTPSATNLALKIAGNKEKVQRIALMTLSRLLDKGGHQVEVQLVESGLPRIVKLRSAQSFADEDIPDLLEKLDDKLGDTAAAMSSLERYKQEVLSGALEWGPMHTSQQFWQVRDAVPAHLSFLLQKFILLLVKILAGARRSGCATGALATTLLVLQIWSRLQLHCKCKCAHEPLAVLHGA